MVKKVSKLLLLTFPIGLIGAITKSYIVYSGNIQRRLLAHGLEENRRLTVLKFPIFRVPEYRRIEYGKEICSSPGSTQARLYKQRISTTKLRVATLT